MEQFKDIPGWEGLYQVSNTGSVKSLSRLVGRNNGLYLSKDRILRTYTFENGYKYVILQSDGYKKHFRIHRLVLMAFVGMPPTKDHVGMHNDDNPANNHLENLKWGTLSDNTQESFDKGRRSGHAPNKGRFGAKMHNSKKVIQISKDGNEVNRFDAISEAHRATNIFNIHACLTGKIPHAGGFKWKYA